MNYLGTIYNTAPAPQRTGITNNILPYYTDYNVTIFDCGPKSGGNSLQLNDLFYTARFNGYCVHADCRATLIPQWQCPIKLSIYDITLHVIDQLGRQFQRNLPFGGQLLPGVPHVYPFLSGYDVDFMTQAYENANKPTTPPPHNFKELAIMTAADMFGNSYFPWCGFGEIIYYNPKRKAYEEEYPSYAGKTPLNPIPELIEFSEKNENHPLVQIHYWIGNDEAYNDLVGWAKKNPHANIILCHGGYEKGDDIKDWILKVGKLPKNVLVEISWTLLDMIYDNRDWIFDHLPCIHWVFGTDATPCMNKNGRDIAFVVDRLVQVAAMLTGPRFVRPIEGNSYYPFYKVPNGGDVLVGEQKPPKMV